MEVRLPGHSVRLLGLEAGFGWTDGTWTPLALAGLLYGGVATVNDGRALILTADLDVDTDGLGGGKAIDPWWRGETSLRTAAGVSLDSREFPGYVMAPALRERGVRLGDFGFAVWGGRMVAFQIYDVGPTTKAGEGSIRLARELGLVRPSESDHLAANGGHAHADAKDVSVVIFPRSAPGTGEKVANHALPAGLIEAAARSFLPGRE